MSRSILRAGPWVVIPGGLAIWVFVAHSRFYFVFDEWVMIERATRGSPLREMLIGFNGHLWVGGYWVAKLHVDVFGMDSSTFSYLVLALSLLALQVLAALVLVRLGVPSIVALLVTALVVYFGRGSETMIYELEYSANFALAASCGAAALALGFVRQRDPGAPSTRLVALVAGLLVLATLLDSSLALVALFFVAPLLVWCWPRRQWLLALGIAVGVHVLWYVADSTGLFVPSGPCQNCSPVSFDTSLGDAIEFGANLLLRAAGGLVGGTKPAGAVVLVVLVALVALVLWRCAPPPPVLAALVGGALATAATVGSIAYSRTGFWASVDEAISSLDVSNRYVQPAAFFLALGVVPVLAVGVRAVSDPGRLVLNGVGIVVIVVAFVLNLPSVDRTRDFYEGWSTSVREDVRDTVAVLEQGCPDGTSIDPAAQPIDLSFQVDAGLIRELVDRGALSPDRGRVPPPEMVELVCGKS